MLQSEAGFKESSKLFLTEVFALIVPVDHEWLKLLFVCISVVCTE